MSKLDIAWKKCVHCGACTAVCKEDALKIETKSWTISYDEFICRHCNSCVNACPSRALSFQPQIRRSYVSEKRLSQIYENR